MVAVMVLVDYKPNAKLWGFMRLVMGALSPIKAPGLKFVKVLGSGHEGGFGLKPSTTRQGLFCVFDTESHADDFLNHSKTIAAYKDHAQEFFSTKLVAYSSRGSWSGQTIPVDAKEPDEPQDPTPANTWASNTAPSAMRTAGQTGLKQTRIPRIATLTRASIRPLKARAFWSKSPPSEASLQHADGCLLSTGLGEAPFFRQATFSLWESTAAMNQFARTGAHLEAIKASHSGDYFSESMFVRFVPISPKGVWKGSVFG